MNRAMKELNEVRKMIRRDHPRAVDYNVIDLPRGHYAELLDKNHMVVGFISERALTRYWNDAEAL